MVQEVCTHDYKVIQIRRWGNGDSLFLNGVKVVEYDKIYEAVVSPNRTRYAAIVQHSGNKFVWLDGEEYPAYRDVSDMLFSPDDMHFAYVAELEDGSKQVVLDNMTGKNYVRVSNLTFSDYGVLAYKAFSLSTNKYCMVVGCKEDGYWGDDISGYVWGPYGHYAYIVCDGGEYYIILDGNKERKCESVTELQFKLIPHFMYEYWVNGEMYLAKRDVI